MRTRIRRGAAALVAAVLIGGCGGDDDPEPALLAGEWSGSLVLTYKGGGSAAGALNLDLGQQEDFVSGSAAWSPSGGQLPVAGPIDGQSFSLIVHFRCANGDLNSPTTAITEGALITGTAAGDTLTFTAASGTACPGGGVGTEVGGASGSVTRSSNQVPLGTTPPVITDPTFMTFQNVECTSDGDDYSLRGNVINTGSVTRSFAVVTEIKDGDIAFGDRSRAELDENPLDPGMKTEFEASHPADGHTSATITYWGEADNLKTPEYTVDCP